MFESLKSRLSIFTSSIKDKTSKSISTTTKIKAAIAGSVTLSGAEIDDILWQLTTDLLQNDVSLETAEYLSASIKDRLTKTQITTSGASAQIRGIIKDSLREALETESNIDLVELIRKSEKPYVIIFLGVNGTGKTTTLAKMAKHLKDSGFSVVFAAADTFRAGAIEQLNQQAERLGVKVISHQRGADSAAVIFDAIEHAKAKKIDVVLADTAGRMHSKVNLMEELSKIVRVNKPNLKIFVADSLAGNDAIEQARAFNDAVGFDAAVLSKMDADAKGGAALSIVHTTKKPIIYIGVGQGLDDLKKFDQEWFLSNVCGD